LQLSQSLLLCEQGVLGLGPGALRKLELTLQLAPVILAVVAFSLQSLELDACLLELPRARVGVESLDPRLLLELTYLILVLLQRSRVSGKRALDCSQLGFAFVLLGLKETDVRLGHLLGLGFRPVRRSLGGSRSRPFFPPDELCPKAGAVALLGLEPG